jgi:NADPH-dependent 2,4-dienoyl-CoA reductase/sulfur reductase-like enzyme
VVERLVVVGADAAGMSAAHQALRTAAARGRELEVLALERSGHTSYSACGIPYWVAGDVPSGDALVARTADQHRAAGIDLRLHTVVEAIDPAAGTVDLRDLSGGRTGGTGGTERVGYDHLLLATGAHPVEPAWARTADGEPVPGVHAVRSLDDGAVWLDRLTSTDRPPRTGVVVGGGYIGLEMAEAFLRRGLEVTLVTRGEVMGSLDPDLGARVREQLVAAGVTVVTGAEIDDLELDDGHSCCLAAGGRRFDADVVALGLGARPETELAAAAGLPLGDSGGLLPDDRQQLTAGPGDDWAGSIWAAGDCCESYTRLDGGRRGGIRVFVPLGTHANKQGRVAGENLAGGDARFGGVLGTAVTRFSGGGVTVEIGRTGPTSAQAAAAGYDVVSLVTESTTASGYMPEASPIAVKVLADRGTRRLLGVQLVGGPGTAKRVDLAAVAIWTSQTVDEVAGMDLAYAPPFSPVWDPVQIACRRLADRW